MTDQEINEKLARAVGFVFLPRGDKMHGRDVWQYPEGILLYELPEFLYGMDACLAWIVPELRKLKITRILFFYTENSVECHLGGEIHTWADNKVESRAFCLAALKYFEEMGKNAS